MTPQEVQRLFAPYVDKFIEIFKGGTFAKYVYFEKTKSGIFIPAGPKKEDDTRELVPLTAADATWHLAGCRPVIHGPNVRWEAVRLGSYPLEKCKYCHWVGADIDNHATEDPNAVRLLIETCWRVVVVARKYGLKVYLERSNSGNGVHLFIFFNILLPAMSARRVLFRLISAAGILTEKTVTTKHDRKRTVLIVENSGGADFDRMFPTQDEVRPGQLGNLISLPYNGPGKWENGKTAFLDLGSSGKLPEDGTWPIVKLSEFVNTVKRHSVFELNDAYMQLLSDGFAADPPGAHHVSTKKLRSGQHDYADYTRKSQSSQHGYVDCTNVDWLDYLKTNNVEVSHNTDSSAILAECPYCGETKKAWVSLKSGWLNCWRKSCDACEENGLAPSVWIQELGLKKPRKKERR